MNTVLYFSVNGAVYETRAYTQADITELVHHQGLQSLTSGDRQFDFWFSPTSRRCQRGVNRRATELLLATTSFDAKTVPLLRGAIVVATHDADGDLDGLSWEQLEQLARKNRSVSARDKRILSRRIARDRNRLRRAGTTAPDQRTAAPQATSSHAR
ncbi:hypothetical protein [Mycolicibacterium sp. J2]|uniref:hypothetical protein n=1 Tax=Mycolicibacterium sp. J2 TaxID=2993511 RepID=UPI00224A6ED6|nr:hypothetical protein [Mycolicibacterium sp. J2]MCX2712847.1 hypothetical protein [Mycolicibacterium sp. J2]